MSLSTSSFARQPISVIGAGIAGTWQALTLARAGFEVVLHERSDASLDQSTAYFAGGMLAPWCEQEASEEVVTRLGVRSLALWRGDVPETPFNGSLVVAHPRDRADFERFARLTSNHSRVGDNALAQLEPTLAGRFNEGLFFADEGHVEPRKVLSQLHQRLTEAGAEIRFGSETTPQAIDGTVIDCRGLAARDDDGELRGVKGEMIVVETSEISLQRPVRLIHPRWPLYIIPRDDNRFMIGATSIESEDRGVTVRSALELLSAAYAVHPAFAEARIVEIGAALRPAYPDHLPRITIRGDQIRVNGLYRHGFLLAPALAELTADFLARGTIDNEVMRWS